MKLIVSLFAALFLSGAAGAATLEEDVATYVAIFNGDVSRHNDAVESLAWMGISDSRVFDILERRILEEAQGAKSSREQKDRVARYFRALGFSGQEKYTKTISSFALDNVYQRFAGTALEDMPNYRIWNPVISNRATFDPKNTDDVNRILNMLRSNDMRLKRIGAKRVYFQHKDKVLLEMLVKEVQANYDKVTDSNDADTVAWMVKALGNTRNPVYRPLIQEVAVKAKHPKIIKYAQQALVEL